jgi:predicted nucleic acid-binding protein
VVNASPVIFLTQIQALPLLKELATEVAIPAAVKAEVLAGERRHDILVPVEFPKWMTIVPDILLPEEVAGWDLGAGESQVLAHAIRLGGNCEAVLDDLQARRCARGLGIATTGTLGIILRAKQAGLIPAARPLVEDLLRKGLYLARELVEMSLGELGELRERSRRRWPDH